MFLQLLQYCEFIKFLIHRIGNLKNQSLKKRKIPSVLLCRLWCCKIKLVSGRAGEDKNLLMVSSVCFSVFPLQARDAVEPTWREEADRWPELAKQDHVDNTVGPCTHGPTAHACTTCGKDAETHFGHVVVSCTT